MRNFLIIAVILGQCGLSLLAQESIYQNDFSNTDLKDFHFTDASAWKWEEGAMELFGKSNYEPPVRSPYNIAILKEVVVSDFVLEVDLKQTGREYGHRDMCLFFGINNPSNFYYVHMASVADPNAHNIFLVNDEDRTNIATKTTEGVQWGNQWNKVKIERNSKEGTIKVYFIDMENPIMEAVDHHFKAGYIGFGSFDDTGKIDNIRLVGERAVLRQFFD